MSVALSYFGESTCLTYIDVSEFFYIQSPLNAYSVVEFKGARDEIMFYT